MKIFYAVQATGNGHISRAMELLPHLRQYGEVDIFLSGSNSTLPMDNAVKYRSKGMSLHYTCNGSLDYTKTFLKCSMFRLFQEARDLPVEKYDLVLNDFESITSIACHKKKVPMIHFGHQASFVSDNTPRPEQRSQVGEWILKNYVKSALNVGLHFDSYDDFICPPVIKESFWKAAPMDLPYVTVYLPSYCDKQLIQIFSTITNIRFEIFSRQAKQPQKHQHINIIPVEKEAFNASLIGCHGIITGAGFETPAEALFLKKKLIAIPIERQYEQICNGAALEKLGVKVLKTIDSQFKATVEHWLEQPDCVKPINFKSTSDIVDTVFALSNRFSKIA